MRVPSDATQLKAAKRDIRQLQAELTVAKSDAVRWKSRADIAEREWRAWMQRFDILLKRDMTSPRAGQGG